MGVVCMAGRSCALPKDCGGDRVYIHGHLDLKVCLGIVISVSEIKEGNMVAYAHSLWVYMDMKKDVR